MCEFNHICWHRMRDPISEMPLKDRCVQGRKQVQLVGQCYRYYNAIKNEYISDPDTNVAPSVLQRMRGHDEARFARCLQQIPLVYADLARHYLAAPHQS